VAVIKKYLVAAALLVCLEGTSQARLKYNLLYNIFNQDGSGGKQVYDGSGDQALIVYEPVLFMDYDINYKTVLSGTFLVDTFSSASDAIFDTKTGASGGAGTSGRAGKDNEEDKPAAMQIARKWEQRKAFDLSLSHRMGTCIIIPSLGSSDEEDYRSVHGGINLLKSFAEDNFTLAAGFIHFDDKAMPFDLNTLHFLGWTPKITDSCVISATQILGPGDIALLGAGFTRQTGYLSGDRNTVDLAGIRVSEVLPDERNKITSTLRLVHGLSGSLALHFDYRYYSDDWQLRAHTFEPSLALGFGEADAGVIHLFYRYYVQNGAAYYRDSFTSKLVYMTSDSDLQGFFASEAGLQGTYRLDLKGFLSDIELGFGIIYYRRSNDLNAAIYQLSFGGEF